MNAKLKVQQEELEAGLIAIKQSQLPVERVETGGGLRVKTRARVADPVQVQTRTETAQPVIPKPGRVRVKQRLKVAARTRLRTDIHVPERPPVQPFPTRTKQKIAVGVQAQLKLDQYVPVKPPGYPYPVQEEEKRKPKPMRLMTKTRSMYPPQPPPDDEPESSTTGTSVWSRRTPPSPTPSRRGWRRGGGPSGPSDPDTDPTQGYPTTSGGETTGTETDVSRPIQLKFTAEADDIFPLGPHTTETETGYSSRSQPSRKPFPERHRL